MKFTTELPPDHKTDLSLYLVWLKPYVKLNETDPNGNMFLAPGNYLWRYKSALDNSGYPWSWVKWTEAQAFFDAGDFSAKPTLPTVDVQALKAELNRISESLDVFKASCKRLNEKL